MQMPRLPRPERSSDLLEAVSISIPMRLKNWTDSTIEFVVDSFA
jgi:hypothetical protein